MGDRTSQDLLSAEEFAHRRRWRVEFLPEACEAHRIFCLKQEGVELYPAFLADPRYNIRRLEAITKRLGDLPGGIKWMFYTTGKGSLGGATPLDALRAGKFALVMRCAQGFVER